MPTETMLSLSVENLEAKMNLIKEEEQHHNRLINALHIWISGSVALINEQISAKPRFKCVS